MKQSKPGKHFAPLVFPDEEKLCIVRIIQEYLKRTWQYQSEHSQLLLSYDKPFKPVSKNTIARWVKMVLQSAGVDITKYSTQSSRAALTSTCRKKGLTMKAIKEAAGWSNAQTFAGFYEKPNETEGENFSKVVLQQ